jgi:hypothetical protein
MTNEITIKTSAECSIISITNYDLYQSNDKPIDKPIASEMTNESQTNDKPIATNKNIRSKRSKELQEEKDTIVSKKKKYGIAGLVHLTDDEYDRLVKDFGEVAVNKKIDALEYWLNKGNKSKSDNLTIRNWFRRDQKTVKEDDWFYNYETGKREARK